MTQPLSRRAFLMQATAVTGLGILASHTAGAQPAATRITVYKDPNCGCCKNWNTAMQKAGFALSIRDSHDLATVKGSLGVPQDLASCHTGVVAGYLFEGHVPPDLVQKVLRERPPIVGLFVPGMPGGSPGMEGPNPERYDIVAVARNGRRTVYATRMGKAEA